MIENIINVFDFFKYQTNYKNCNYEISPTSTIYFKSIDQNDLLNIIELIQNKLNLEVLRIAYYNKFLFIELNL